MKLVISTFAILLICIGRPSAQGLTPVDTSKYYEFHINYWFNAHHFLWLEAFMNVERDSTIITEKLPKKDLKTWNEAIGYYKKNLIQEDLRSSDYMQNFKTWVITQDESLENIPESLTAHVEILKSIHPIYQTYFWSKHKSACQEALSNNIELLRTIESDYVDQITTLTRQFWDFTRIRVDISYVAKSNKWNIRNKPYTSLFPTHVVMNAVGENDVRGNWIELLFHESAHHLILPSNYFVGGTIKDYTQAKGVKAPRQLWHAYLFYFTGQITKDLLIQQGIDYPDTYMERNEVFSRYFPLLQKHLRTYMDHDITLSEATYLFIEDLNKGGEQSKEEPGR